MKIKDITVETIMKNKVLLQNTKLNKSLIVNFLSLSQVPFVPHTHTHKKAQILKWHKFENFRMPQI